MSARDGGPEGRHSVSLSFTFQEVRGDVRHGVVAGGGAGQRMSEAETRLATFRVGSSEVVESRLAPARAHARAREAPCLMSLLVAGNRTPK